jgi:hypothetical protein
MFLIIYILIIFLYTDSNGNTSNKLKLSLVEPVNVFLLKNILAIFFIEVIVV